MASAVTPHDQPLLLLGSCTVVLLTLRESWVALEVLAATSAFAVAVVSLRPRSERAALLLTWGYALWFYWAVARIVPALGRQAMDAQLLALDTALFGEMPAVWLQNSPSAFVDLCSLAYLAYLPYLHGVLFSEIWRAPERARGLGRRLYLAFALGYAGYLLVPAVGPRLAAPERFAGELGGSWVTEVVLAGMTAGSPGFDVFPSLHVLITAVIWTHDWRHHRRRALWMAPVVGLLVLSTLLLRFHYAVDLLAAAVVFGVVSALSSRHRES